jgi:hypothetical protein
VEVAGVGEGARVVLLAREPVFGEQVLVGHVVGALPLERRDIVGLLKTVAILPPTPTDDERLDLRLEFRAHPRRLTAG